MTEHNPAEWFRLGKVQQFEGNHQQAVSSFEQSLIGEWRVEVVVKELYNSLVKLKRFEQALAVLERYQEKITQKQWLNRERLNIYKKMGATDRVSEIYCDLLRKTTDHQMIQDLINELTLYYYRQELYDGFDLFSEAFSRDECLEKWQSVLHIKWILHVFKDLKLALKLHAKVQGAKTFEAMTIQDFYTFLEDYADRMEFKYVVTDHLKRQLNGLLTHYEKVVEDDARVLLHKYMGIPCIEWSIEGIVRLGQHFINERPIRLELQQYAQMLLKQEDMRHLNILAGGLPDLYNQDDDSSLIDTPSPQENQWPQDDLQPPAEQDEITLRVPKWSNSEMQYLDAFIERLGQSIDSGLRYVKQFVVAPIGGYALSHDETTDTLWRMRRHYEKNMTSEGWIWFKHLTDLLLKDLANVGLWMEVPYVAMKMAQTELVVPQSKSALVAAGNNAWLYALYGIDKRYDDFTVPVKALHQETYTCLTHQAIWQDYVRYHQVMTELGFKLSRWDQLYGQFKSVVYCEKVMEEQSIEDGQVKVQRVISETYFVQMAPESLDLIESQLFRLSHDLNSLTESPESHRYMRFFKDAFRGAFTCVNDQKDPVFSMRAKKVLDHYLGLCGQDKLSVALELLRTHHFENPFEKLVTYLATICTVNFFECSQQQLTVLDSESRQMLFDTVPELLGAVKNEGLERVFSILKDGLWVDGLQFDLDGNGLLLLDHVLVCMIDGESIDEQLFLEAKVALLETVQLEVGLALFQVLHDLDPASLAIQFHLIDFLCCNRRYQEADLNLQGWFAKHNLISQPSEADKRLFEIALYQLTWLQDTADLGDSHLVWEHQIDELPEPEFYLKLHQVIKSLTKSLKVDELDFLRDICIHWDAELFGEMLRLQGDGPLLRHPEVIRLCEHIFSMDYYANILKIHENSPNHIYLAAYCEFESKNFPEHYRYFQVVKTHYRSVYGEFGRWLTLFQGKAIFNEKKWQEDLNDAIAHQRRDQFKWLCALLAYIEGGTYASTLIAGCLEAQRLPKWEQDGFWRMAYELISAGQLAYHIGEDALKQGRYKDAFAYFRHLKFADLALVLGEEVKMLSDHDAKNRMRYFYCAYLASKLSNAPVERGEKPLETKLTQAQWRRFHKNLYQWLWRTDGSISLREAFRQWLMKSKQSELIILWYAQEQREIGNHQLADKLETDLKLMSR